MLAEGLELSNLFYFWLSGTLDRYLGDSATIEEREIFRENVFGISLSATGLSEVRLMEVHNDVGDVFCTRLCFRHDWLRFVVGRPSRQHTVRFLSISVRVVPGFLTPSHSELFFVRRS